MKYLFLLSEKFYRFIEWEWNTLKNLRRTKRKNFFLRGSFALFSLLSVLFLIFSPPIAFGMLFGEGLKFRNQLNSKKNSEEIYLKNINSMITKKSTKAEDSLKNINQ